MAGGRNELLRGGLPCHATLCPRCQLVPVDDAAAAAAAAAESALLPAAQPAALPAAVQRPLAAKWILWEEEGEEEDAVEWEARFVVVLSSICLWAGQPWCSGLKDVSGRDEEDEDEVEWEDEEERQEAFQDPVVAEALWWPLVLVRHPPTPCPRRPASGAMSTKAGFRREMATDSVPLPGMDTRKYCSILSTTR